MENITREFVEANLKFVKRWSTGWREITYLNDFSIDREDDWNYIKDEGIVCRNGQPECILPFFDAYIERCEQEYCSVPTFMYEIGLLESEMYYADLHRLARVKREAMLAEIRAEEEALRKAKKAEQTRAIAEAKKPLNNCQLGQALKALGYS